MSDPRLPKEKYEPGPAKIMLPKEGGVERLIEPYKTYRGDLLGPIGPSFQY